MHYVLSVQYVFTSYNSVNQAIQPRVVGPLLQKKGGGAQLIIDFWIWFGTPGGQSILVPPGKKGYAQFFRACFLM